MDSWLGFICLLLFVLMNVCSAGKYRIISNTTKEIVIDFENQSNSVIPQNLKTIKYERICFLHFKTNVLTTEMQSALRSATVLDINDGFIGSAHLMTQYEEVNINSCSLGNFIIHPGGMFQIQVLRLTNNALQQLPKHLNVLKNLEVINLQYNLIECIEMAEFNGLNNLRDIDLQRNKIIEIRATLQNPVNLPKLQLFDASQNHLTDISFEHWNTTLRYIYLERNELQIAISLPRTLPRLKAVVLNGNPFNCEWPTPTLKELQDRNVTVLDTSLTKCNAAGPDLKEIVRRINLKEMIAAFPFLQISQSELENVLINQLKNFDAFSRNVSTSFEHLKKQIFSITKTIDSYKLESNKRLESKTDQKFHQLERKLDELQHQQNCRIAAILVILGLFFCFYLMKKMVNYAACTDRKRHFHDSVIQVSSFADALQ